MNFFKSMFSSDLGPSDSSSDENSPPVSPHKPHEGVETESSALVDADPDRKTNAPWIGLGGLIKTFASKSESVIQTYRRDLEEFSSELKKETEAIRDVATRAVRDLPFSLEAGASVAQESLESVGQAIDDIGGSLWRSTAEIISEGKDVLLASDSDAETISSDIQTNSAGMSAQASKRYSRFEAQVFALQSDPCTFSEAPDDVDDFHRWISEFKLEEKEEEIETLCYDNGALEDLFDKLVPSVVDLDTFWNRYFYKFHKLKLADDVRANFVKRVISREDEENLTWEVEDDEEELKNKEGEGERIELVKEEEDEAISENKEEFKERVDSSAVEQVQEKKPDEVEDNLSLEIASEIDNEKSASSVNLEEDDEPASSETAIKSGGEAKLEPVESFEEDDSDKSMKEDDLGWDEIADIGDHDDKKVGESSSNMNMADLPKRSSLVDEDEDLTWDIEDDD